MDGRERKPERTPEIEGVDPPEASPASPERLTWVSPKLEKLSLKRAESSSATFRTNDGVTNYS